MDLGRRLREARQRRSLSLYDVGERTGLHFSTIAKYERGERRPDIEVLRELAAVYDTTLGQLLSEDDEVVAAFPPSLRGVAQQLVRRHELQALLEMGCRLRPDQVTNLVALVHSLMSRLPGDATPPGTP